MSRAPLAFIDGVSPAPSTPTVEVGFSGGAYVDEPTILHWLAYTDMANDTGAAVVVPIYPLVPEGTAGTLEP